MLKLKRLSVIMNGTACIDNSGFCSGPLTLYRVITSINAKPSPVALILIAFVFVGNCLIKTNKIITQKKNKLKNVESYFEPFLIGAPKRYLWSNAFDDCSTYFQLWDSK